jgi:uncharacterized protein (DUF2236 family)
MARPPNRSPELGDLLDPCPPPAAGRHGDPGLYGPGSAAWTIGRERALLAGGGAALLLQVAHPKVAAGVAQHSGFRRDPFARLRATLDAMLRVTFGDTDQAHAAAREVAMVHRRVRGRLAGATGSFESGEPYSASDPDLALWVHATLVRTALDAFERFVRPLLPGEAERYYLETRVQAELFGVPATLLPPDLPAFDAYVRQMLDGGQVAVSPEALAMAPQILHPPVPLPVRPALGAVAVLTAGLLPARLRHDYGLPWHGTDRAMFVAVAGATKASVRVLPPRYRFWPHHAVAERRMSPAAGAAGGHDAGPPAGRQ